jgi:cytochrome c
VGNLIRWIMRPSWIDPRTAMPDLGVDGEAAQDMAAYLYSLE